MPLDKKITADERDSAVAEDASTGEGGALPAAANARVPSRPAEEALPPVGEVIRRFRRGRWTLTQA